jgi:hypothetical protein
MPRNCPTSFGKVNFGSGSGTDDNESTIEVVDLMLGVDHLQANSHGAALLAVA